MEEKCIIDGQPYYIYYGLDEHGETIEVLKPIDTDLDYDCITLGELTLD